MQGIRWRDRLGCGPTRVIAVEGLQTLGIAIERALCLLCLGRHALLKQIALKGPFGSKATCVVLGGTPGAAGVVQKGKDIGLLLWVGQGIALRQGKAQDGLTLRR